MGTRAEGLEGRERGSTRGRVMDQASLLLRKQLKGAGVGFASAAEAFCKLLSAARRCVGALQLHQRSF